MPLRPGTLYDIVALQSYLFPTPGRAPMSKSKAQPSRKRRRLASREDAVVTSFALPRPLHQRLMIASVRLNWTLAQVLRDAAEQWLAKHEPTASRRADR